MTKTERRKAQLLEMLQVSRELRVGAVAEALDISEATVRRLFVQMENEGKLLRVHGGVRLAPQISYDYSYRLSLEHRRREKVAIGKAAAELVENGDSIFLDSGTTILRLAEALILKVQAGALQNVVVVTNSLTHIEGLAKWCKVILIGGEIRSERRDVCGSIAEKNLSMFHVDKAFLGADAVHAQKGLMTTDERTSKMDEVVISHADRTFAVVDSEKFNRTSFMSYAELGDVDAIITDDGLDKETRQAFAQRGIALRIVGGEG